MTDHADQNDSRNPWEQAIVQGLIDSLLAPRIVGHYRDQQGELIPQWSPSPLSQLADSLWSTHRAQIVEATSAAVDVEALGRAIADRFVKDVVDSRHEFTGWQSRQHVQSIRAKADELVARALADEQLARIKAEGASD